MTKWFIDWLRRRGSYFRIYTDSARDSQFGHDLYLDRYFLFRWPGRFGLFLHCLHSSDPDGVHDHPWPNMSFVLRGGYFEQFHDRTILWRPPFSLIFRRAKDLHRLILEHPHSGGEVWSLFVHFKRCRRWGFIRGGDWVDSDFHADGDKEPLKSWIFPYRESADPEKDFA